MWDHWFNLTKKEFSPLLLPFAGKPIVYVEIGCWAGASCEWVGRNVLTHPESYGIGIDPYPPERKHPQEEIDRIIAHAKARVNDVVGDRWQWIKKDSHQALRELDLGGRSIDALYIDGCHDGWAVVSDFALAWRFLRTGSVVIFDDYLPRKEMPFGPDNRGGTGHPHVVAGFDAIKQAWGSMVREVGKHRRQRALEIVKRSYWDTP